VKPSKLIAVQLYCKGNSIHSNVKARSSLVGGIFHVSNFSFLTKGPWVEPVCKQPSTEILLPIESAKWAL
jgi:hypothetical protein